MKLEGKVAVVTGAASGIGRGIVRRFAAEGARLVAVDLDEARLHEVCAELSGAGAEVRPVAADVTDPEHVDRFVGTALEAWGRLDVLCNNAGVLDALAPVHETDDALWARVLAVNLHGPFLACRRAIPAMREQGGGSIVNTASSAAFRGGRGGAAYTASKHAVVGLTQNIAWFYGPEGIRCNAIAPGSILTRMNAQIPTQSGMERAGPYFPLIPTPGKAADVAAAALFLASEDGRYVNGAVLPVDGGWTAY